MGAFVRGPCRANSGVPCTSYALEAELPYTTHFGAERGGWRVVRDGRQERDREHRLWEYEGGLKITFGW
jgi:hypothetical protein